MMTSKIIFTLVITITAILDLVSSAASSRPAFYTGCQSSEECMPGFCCTMSPYKYSVPSCNALKQEGEMCRPGGAPTLNTTLSYPDGSLVEITNVHYIMCPCSHELTCDSSDGMCRDPSKNQSFNEILNKPGTQDDQNQ